MREIPIDFTNWVQWTFGKIKHPYYFSNPKFFSSYHHWLTLDGKTLKVDYVGKLETLEDNLKEIEHEHGIHLDVGKLNVTSGDKSKLRQEVYNDETKELVRRVHEVDIQTWGYEF